MVTIDLPPSPNCARAVRAVYELELQLKIAAHFIEKIVLQASVVGRHGQVKSRQKYKNIIKKIIYRSNEIYY